METAIPQHHKKARLRLQLLTCLAVGSFFTMGLVGTANASTTTTADGYTVYYGSDLDTTNAPGSDSLLGTSASYFTGSNLANHKIQMGLEGATTSFPTGVMVAGNEVPDASNTISGGYVRIVEGTYGDSTITSRTPQDKMAFIAGGTAIDGYLLTNNPDAIDNNTPEAQVTDNHVLITGTATVTGNIVGADTYANDANNNTITIDGNATVNLPTSQSIVGGYTYLGNANGNTITINGGTITGSAMTNSISPTAIIGGAAFNDTKSANDNTINLNGGTISGIDLYGGSSMMENIEYNHSSNNTVNVAAANSFNFHKINFVQNLNFLVPSTIKNGDTMLSTENLTLHGDMTVNTTVNSQAALKAGDVVHLLAASSITNNGFAINLANTTVALPSVSRDLEGFIAQNGNNIDLTVDYASDNLNADTKSFAETSLVSAALISDGANRLADTVGAAASSALQSANALSPKGLFATTGYGDLRYSTGSHIDSNAWFGTLGVASEMKNSLGTFLYAPFLEYGHTNYDSYLNDGTHGSGDAKYYGLGLWLKQTNTNGTYFEGSLRGGKTTGNYTSSDFLDGATNVNYDYGTKYYGFHVGIGHVNNLTPDKTDTIDTYARYFYTHQSGYDATIAGDDYTFDAVNSSWIRIGTRLTHAFNPNSSIYYGAGYQYQFTGNSTGYMGGLATDSPTLKGGTGLVELGFKQQLAKDFAIDASATDYFGREKGVTFKVDATYKF